MVDKKISMVHFLMLATGKILIGVSLGVLLATKFFFIQPYWFLILIVGAFILVPVLKDLWKHEAEWDKKLHKKNK